jgi:hypothetical protein
MSGELGPVVGSDVMPGSETVPDVAQAAAR